MPIKKHPITNAPLLRSGAVARLTGIPVETLRVWERRYSVVGPRQSDAGQRLYSPDEVDRLSTIKKLVGAGYAIGSIAKLDLKQLQSMLDKTASAEQPSPRFFVQHATLPFHAVVVGEAIGLRLERHPLPALQVVASSPNIQMAMQTMRESTADALIIELATLQSGTPLATHKLAQKLGVQTIIVAYEFGPKQVEKEMLALGCQLLRSPLEIDQLASALGISSSPDPLQIGIAAPRIFDRKTLAEIAMTSVPLHCGCPHHLAYLVARLGSFETYSAECENHSPKDADLHRKLGQIAGNARAALEAALAQVIEANGIMMPVSQIKKEKMSTDQ
jgi:MerR family transcriptional regulator, light-induced transcriptional regulator